MAHDLDQALVPFFRRQLGTIARSQVLEAGGTRHQIATRLRSGRWLRPYPSVYTLADSPRTPRLALFEAAMAVRGRGGVGHEGAGWAWGFDGCDPSPPTAIVRHPDHHRITGLLVRQRTDLEPRDLVELDGLLVTRPARTVFDLAEVMSDGAFESAMASAVAKRRVTKEQLGGMFQRLARPGKRGIRRFVAVYERIFDGSGPTESELERIVLNIIRRFDLPMPERQVRTGAGRVDFYWPDLGIVLEVDGRAYHARYEEMRADRERDLELAAEGIKCHRVMWEMIVEDEMGFVRRLDAILRRATPALV